jgi:hypothetical protein
MMAFGSLITDSTAGCFGGVIDATPQIWVNPTFRLPEFASWFARCTSRVSQNHFGEKSSAGHIQSRTMSNVNRLGDIWNAYAGATKNSAIRNQGDTGKIQTKIAHKGSLLVI